ncbi:hypothetical protein D9757_013641 [Collybiopsis confluens]|uniref:Uncharacterized protein n=1 Tax=Collybiopsis confluens TaxID=2823264 RepID=A0A8H5LK48_9AGAR|nr:hypothetical protein D9757_013641 [Collybiopsis confluens]
MHITSAYLIACLFSIGYAFPVENEHNIRAIPVAPAVIKVRFTSKTTTDSGSLDALNAETYVRQFLGRSSVKDTFRSEHSEVEFMNHNGGSGVVHFEVIGPPMCPCPGEIDLKSASHRGQPGVRPGEFKLAKLFNHRGAMIDTSDDSGMYSSDDSG